MPTHPLLPTALQSTPFTYFAFCFSFLLFNDFPTDKLCSKYWEARSTYSTVHWAHCSLSVPEQMEVGLQSCSSQDSSVTMCESHDISSAFWLTNLCASHFYFLFFSFNLEFGALKNIILLETHFQCHLLDADANPMFVHFTHQNQIFCYN